ncbi:MAG: UDP-N-acetylmuramate dehydrogenase [Firmicutes bacterium]|nr:UDP-N-acetylmuramate dehydrogenase [Bacillota bacterium]
MKRESFESLLADIENCEVRYDVPASELDTFGIGGAAFAVLYPKTSDALVSVIRRLNEEKIKHAVIGKGSNIIVSDDGYDGAFVMTSALKGMHIDGDTLFAMCGDSISQCAVTAADAGLSGLEFAYGIPGSVGGAVYMNAGAYGGEIKDVFLSGEFYDSERDKIVILTPDKMEFAYRESIMKHERLTLLTAKLRLTAGERDAIRAKMNENMKARREKQPLEYPSAGSVFKRYPGYYTAKLIDEAGFRGYRIGGAEVSEKHAGFIVNRGGATANDVMLLIKLITDKIYELHGIKIEREIIYLE